MPRMIVNTTAENLISGDEIMIRGMGGELPVEVKGVTESKGGKITLHLYEWSAAGDLWDTVEKDQIVRKIIK